MDIMKKMLQENIQQEKYQSKTTDELHLERKMGAGENIELKRSMTIGDKIDQLMPKELKKGTQLQKAPLDKNIYFPDDFAKTIQEIIDKKHRKTKEELKQAIQKQEAVLGAYRLTFEKYNVQIADFSYKAEVAQNKAEAAEATDMINTINELKSTLEASQKKETNTLARLKEEYQQRSKGEALLEYGKNLPKTLDDLWAKKDTIIQSRKREEKLDFLDAASKVSVFIRDLVAIDYSAVKNDPRFHELLAQIDKKMAGISSVAAQLALERINFEMLQNQHEYVLSAKEKEYRSKKYSDLNAEFKLIDEEIEKKKAFINALNQKLGQPVQYSNVAITQDAKAEVAAIVEATNKKYINDTLRSYIDANNQMIESFLQYQSETDKDKNQLDKAIKAGTKSLESIKEGKNIVDWVTEIVKGQEATLESNDLNVKCQFVAAVMKMDKFLQFTPLNVEPMHNSDRLFLSLVDYVTIHKRQLEDTVRKVTVQIFNLLNPDFEEPKLDYEDLKKQLDNRSDEMALLETAIKHKMYNPLDYKQDFRLREADYKYGKISDKINGFTQEQIFRFRTQASKEKVLSILEYEKLYKKVYEQMADIPEDQREELATFIASLSQAAQRIVAIDKINTETSTTWLDIIDANKVEEEVNRWEKELQIDNNHISDIETNKIIKIRDYEGCLWDDSRYHSSSMEEMFYLLGQKALDQAFYGKISSLQSQLKESIVAEKQAEYDNAKSEYLKKDAKQNLDKAKMVFELGETIDKNRVVENLVELKNNSGLFQDRSMQMKYIKGIGQLEAYKKGLHKICDNKTADYKHIIQLINWQLDVLSETTAQVSLNLTNFDEIKDVYENAISENEATLKTFKDEYGEEINQLEEKLQLDKFMFYVLGIVKAGYLDENFAKNIEDVIKSLPTVYQAKAKENYNYILSLKAKDVDDLFETYSEAVEIESNNIKQKARSIKANQAQIAKRQKEVSLLEKSRELFSFAQNLNKEKNNVLYSTEVKDKAAFLDKVAAVKDLGQLLSNGYSVKIEDNNPYLKLIGRYFISKEQQLEEVAREVVTSMDKLLFRDYQLPEIDVSKTLSKLKDTKKMDQLVKTMAAYKVYNPEGQGVDNRIADINDFIKKYDNDQISYSDIEKLAFIREAFKQRRECAKDFYALYERLKAQYKGHLSDACIRFMAAQSEEYMKLVAYNGFMNDVSFMAMKNEYLGNEIDKLKKYFISFDGKDIVFKAETVFNESYEFEKKLWDKKNGLPEIYKIFAKLRTRILDNSLA